MHRFQDAMRISEVGGRRPHSKDPSVDLDTEPLRQVNSMGAIDFFSCAAALLQDIPPHATDFSQLARLKLLGIESGRSFDPSRFSSGQRAEVEAGAEAAREALIAAPRTIAVPVNGWAVNTDTMGVYGNFYFRRATIALAGLGANPVEDAIYPLLIADADGDPTVGDTNYLIHFDADQLPPVDAFWSITMYDAEGFQAANKLDRFALGDRDPLAYGPDGSLDIYVQPTNPGPNLEANWLPAPSGPIGITMRLYAPRADALNRTWSAPTVRKN
jgi:hypothetical protein